MSSKCEQIFFFTELAKLSGDSDEFSCPTTSVKSTDDKG